MTPDGSTIVGLDAGPSRQVWRWTRDGGVQLLGRLLPFGFAGASAVSDDGQIIAGVGGATSVNPTTRVPFLWMPELGMINFEQFLRTQGTYFGDATILNAPIAMSSDGRRIVGFALGLGGWVIKMDKVAVCHAPPGNPAKTRSLSVSFPDDFRAHLAHGDTVGRCINPREVDIKDSDSAY